MLEDVVVSVGNDSVQETAKGWFVMGMDVEVGMNVEVGMDVVEGMDVVNSIPGADMFVKVEEDPRKSARKVENINRKRNQGLEKIKILPIRSTET